MEVAITDLRRSIGAVSPVVASLRGQMQRRRATMLYITNEPVDPAARSLVAAETSLQLILDFVLRPLGRPDQAADTLRRVGSLHRPQRSARR